MAFGVRRKVSLVDGCVSIYIYMYIYIYTHGA